MPKAWSSGSGTPNGDCAGDTDAEACVAGLNTAIFVKLTDSGFLPGFLRAGLFARALGGLIVMLEFWLEMISFADGEPGSGLERGGDERLLAELNWGETSRTPTLDVLCFVISSATLRFFRALTSSTRLVSSPT
jgi:hypothetical protein